MPRSSAGARPTAARRGGRASSKRWGATAPGLPPRSTVKPRDRAGWRPATARSRSGWTWPSPASSRYWTRTSETMAQVNATIAGRQYRLACEDGHNAAGELVHDDDFGAFVAVL